MNFKIESTNKFEKFEKIFTKFSNVTYKLITTNINNKLSVATEKTNSEDEQKLREKRP